MIPEQISGSIFIRPNPGAAGYVVRGHRHNFDHTMICFQGRIRVRRSNDKGEIAEVELQAPTQEEPHRRSHLLIEAGIEHEITFIEPGVFWCVYSHRTPQGAISLEATGWEEAYWSPPDGTAPLFHTLPRS